MKTKEDIYKRVLDLAEETFLTIKLTYKHINNPVEQMEIIKERIDIFNNALKHAKAYIEENNQ